MTETLTEHLARIRRIKSARKAAASRLNGKLGGRPLGSKDRLPRKHRRQLADSVTQIVVKGHKDFS